MTANLAPSARRYWTLLANPRIYRIEEADWHLQVDTWTTKGKPIWAGDCIAPRATVRQR